MEQNKTGKYLKYAIGEILLVVIGILIALSINNWNSSRLESKEANSYLSRLSDDLNIDVEYLLSELEISIKESDSLGLFLTLMYDEQTSHDEFLHLLGLGDWNPRNIHLQDNTFIEMNNSGKFDLIESDELKTAILHYYKTRDFAYEHLKATTNHGFEMFMALLPELTRYYNYDALKNHDIFGISDWGWINMKNDIRFKTLSATVAHFKYKANLSQSYFQTLKDKANKILTLIEDLNNK